MEGKYSNYKPNRLIKCKDKLYLLDSPLIMGIVNVTPDSFFEASRMTIHNQAIAHAKKMVEAGADCLDIGGVSTQPQANLLDEAIELKRIIPVIRELRTLYPQLLISVDTFRANVAQKAVEVGANIVNDVYGGTYDSKMFATVAALSVPYILMHCRGTSVDMQMQCEYENVVEDVIFELSERIQKARNAGVLDVIVDPGFGFAKNLYQNYTLLADIQQFEILNCPILMGVSRKSMIYKLLNLSPKAALNGTTVLQTIGLMNNVEFLRVHDVKEAVEIRKIWTALRGNTD